MRRWILVASLAVCGVGACSATQLGRETPCLPEMPVVAPAIVEPGATVVISSEGHGSCDTDEAPRDLLLVLGTAGREPPLALTVTSTQEDGSFSVTATVPPAASPGDAYVTVKGSRYDDACAAATGREGSCASYVGAFEISSVLAVRPTPRAG